jgi:hypothetical protein
VPRFLAVAVAFFCLLALQPFAARAQVPSAKPPAAKSSGLVINDTLRQAIQVVPVSGFADLFQKLSSVEVPDEPTSSFYSRRGRLPGIQRNVQIHVDKGSGQVAFIVLEGSIKITDLGLARFFQPGTLDKIAGTSLIDPIFSVSLLEGDLKTAGLPQDFKDVIARSYYNVPSINVKLGLQIYSKVTVGGVLGKVLEDGLKIPVKDFTMRAGVTGDVPSTPRSKSDAQDKLKADDQMRGMLAKYKEDQEKKDKEAAKKKAAAEGKPAPAESNLPEMFVELQMRPGSTVSGPLGLSPITLSDVTLFLNNKGTVGYKGNARVAGVDKTLLAFYEGPISPSGALDFTDFNMGFASPTLTLADAAQIGMAMSMPGSRLMPGMDKVNGAIRPLLAPLGAFVLRNPLPVPVYKVGDEFPDIADFNVVAIGPLGSIDDQKGPLLKAAGNATVLGQPMANMNVYMSTSGLHGTTSGNLTLDLTKVGLGKPGITMAAQTDVTDAKQAAGMSGSFAGRSLNISMNASEISISSPATCLTPVEVGGSVKYAQTAPTFAQLASAINGVNVDPGKLPGCVGEALKAAYKWIGANGAKLGGYTVAAANEAGKALEQGGKAVGAAVGQGAQIAAQTAADFASGKWTSHPNRPVYDCVDQNPDTNPKLAEAYPPGRMWGSREEYNQRGMNFSRYVFGTDRKFHPILGADAKSTLGGTACGGLVGEDGVGYGRTNTADDEIWTKAVFCTSIPAGMIGAPVNDTRQCYAARGLQKPARPDLWGKFVHITGSGIDLWFIFAQNGAVRQIAKNVPCGSGDQVGMTLHDVYQLPYGGVFSSTAECVASTPAGVAEANRVAQAAAAAAARVAMCQNISNSYGTWAGVSWGWANAGNQNAWSAAGCQTAPTNPGAICRELFRLYGVTPEGWGSIGAEGSESSKLYWAAGCNAMICADAKAKYGVTPASWGNIGTKTAQANIWNQRKCTR